MRGCFGAMPIRASRSSWDIRLDHVTEADSATPAKTPVCTLHLTLRTLHIALENQNLIINDSINNA
jgi:hypothetical protein